MIIPAYLAMFHADNVVGVLCLIVFHVIIPAFILITILYNKPVLLHVL